MEKGREGKKSRERGDDVSSQEYGELMARRVSRHKERIKTDSMDAWTRLDDQIK
jgi:hypothetical protein